MKDPMEVLTVKGYEDWFADVILLRRLVSRITNNIDDLNIGEDEEDLLWKFYNLVHSDYLLKGDE